MFVVLILIALTASTQGNPVSFLHEVDFPVDHGNATKDVTAGVDSKTAVTSPPSAGRLKREGTASVGAPPAELRSQVVDTATTVREVDASTLSDVTAAVDNATAEGGAHNDVQVIAKNADGFSDVEVLNVSSSDREEANSTEVDFTAIADALGATGTTISAATVQRIIRSIAQSETVTGDDQNIDTIASTIGHELVRIFKQQSTTLSEDAIIETTSHDEVNCNCSGGMCHLKSAQPEMSAKERLIRSILEQTQEDTSGELFDKAGNESSASPRLLPDRPAATNCSCPGGICGNAMCGLIPPIESSSEESHIQRIPSRPTTQDVRTSNHSELSEDQNQYVSEEEALDRAHHFNQQVAKRQVGTESGGLETLLGFENDTDTETTKDDIRGENPDPALMAQNRMLQRRDVEQALTTVGRQLPSKIESGQSNVLPIGGSAQRIVVIGRDENDPQSDGETTDDVMGGQSPDPVFLARDKMLYRRNVEQPKAAGTTAGGQSLAETEPTQSSGDGLSDSQSDAGTTEDDVMGGQSPDPVFIARHRMLYRRSVDQAEIVSVSGSSTPKLSVTTDRKKDSLSMADLGESAEDEDNRPDILEVKGKLPEATRKAIIVETETEATVFDKNGSPIPKQSHAGQIYRSRNIYFQRPKPVERTEEQKKLDDIVKQKIREYTLKQIKAEFEAEKLAENEKNAPAQGSHKKRLVTYSKPPEPSADNVAKQGLESIKVQPPKASEDSLPINDLLAATNVTNSTGESIVHETRVKMDELESGLKWERGVTTNETSEVKDVITSNATAVSGVDPKPESEGVKNETTQKKENVMGTEFDGQVTKKQLKVENEDAKEMNALTSNSTNNVTQVVLGSDKGNSTEEDAPSTSTKSAELRAGADDNESNQSEITTIGVSESSTARVNTTDSPVKAAPTKGPKFKTYEDLERDHTHRVFLHPVDTTPSPDDTSAEKDTDEKKIEKMREQEERRLGKLPDLGPLDIRTLGGNDLDIDPVELEDSHPSRVEYEEHSSLPAKKSSSATVKEMNENAATNSSHPLILPPLLWVLLTSVMDKLYIFTSIVLRSPQPA